MFWTSDFTRYYISGCELLFGGSVIWQAAQMGTVQAMFKRELKDASCADRYRAVLERRMQIEGIPSTPWRLAGALTVLLGLLSLIRVVNPLVAYAITCLALGAVSAFILLHLRNRTARRAAVLSPRPGNASIPSWLYAVSILIAVAPFTYVTNANVRVAAIIVGGIAVCMIVLAAMVSGGMAALLTGEDLEIEIVVENRARRARIFWLLGLGMAASFVFMSMTGPTAHPTLYQVVAQLVASLGWLAVWIWIMYGRVKKTRDVGVHVV